MNSLTKTLCLFAVVAAIALAAFLYHRGAANSPGGAQPHAGAGKGAEALPSGVSPVDKDAPAAAEKDTFGQDFARLKSAAEQGFPVAQRKLSEIYGLCMPYSLGPSKWLGTLDGYARIDPGSKRAIEGVKSRLAARCDQVDQGQPIPIEAVQGWMKQAADRGDVAAKVKERISSLAPLTGQEAAELAGAVARSRDPDAMLELANLAQRSIEGGSAGSYAEVMGDSTAGAAWALAACRAGAACQSGSVLMDSVCVSTGKCNYQSYDDFVMKELMTQGEIGRLENVERKIAILINGNP